MALSQKHTKKQTIKHEACKFFEVLLCLLGCISYVTLLKYCWAVTK